MDRSAGHLALRHDDLEGPVAVVGPGRGKVFPVEWVEGLDGHRTAIGDDVRRQLDYYLVELGEPDPWANALYHCGTSANLYSRVHWSYVGPGEDREDRDGRSPFAPFVDRAWEIYARSLAAVDSATVRPSVPILYFGDVDAYLASPLRIVTVGLNPSLEEFPRTAPWSRFPEAAEFDGATSLRAEDHEAYLSALNRYFAVRPYRAWFDRSFEPLLRGAGASYYDGARSVALHTDIASPVATEPTWSRLGARRAQHEGDAALWRELIGALAPDVAVVSVAREHLDHLEPLRTRDWAELLRIERQRPFVVRETEMAFGPQRVLVVTGRCTNVPFGSVSFAERARIGAAVRERAEAIRQEPSER